MSSIHQYLLAEHIQLYDDVWTAIGTSINCNMSFMKTKEDNFFIQFSFDVL